VRLGTPEDVLDESTLAAVFGCEVTVEKSPTTRRPHVQLAWRVEGR
jgi:ABC-type hemin transport system ATPase subunit